MRQGLIVSNTTWNIFNFRLALSSSIRRSGFPVIAVGPADGYETRLGEAVDRHIAQEFYGRSFNPLSLWKSVWRGRRIIRDIKPAFIISFTLKPNLVYSILKERQTKLIVNVAGLGILRGGHDWANFAFRIIFRFILRRADWVFVQNPEDLEYVSRLSIYPNSLSLLPGSGVDINHFRRRGETTSNVLTFAMASRLFRDKGVVEYLEAARRIKASDYTARFLLVGPLEEESLWSIIEAAVEDDIVEYRGKTDDIKVIYEEADIFVYPSAYGEGTPRSVLEAAAMSMPVITTDNIGCREAVKDGITGRIVPKKDSDALASAILEFVEMPRDEIVRMGQAGREFISKNYNETIVIDKYLEVMDKLGIGISKEEAA